MTSEYLLGAAREARTSGVSLSEALRRHGVSPDELREALDPAAYLVWSGQIARGLADIVRSRESG